jgi:hypothetical protein
MIVPFLAAPLATFAPRLSSSIRRRLELVRQIVPGIPATLAKPAAAPGDEPAGVGTSVRCKEKCHSSSNGDPYGDPRGEEG